MPCFALLVSANYPQQLIEAVTLSREIFILLSRFIYRHHISGHWFCLVYFAVKLSLIPTTILREFSMIDPM